MQSLRSRRTLGLAVVAIAACGLVASCGGDDGADDGAESASRGSGKLVVLGSGGQYFRGLNVAYLQPFERETGIDVELVEGGDDPIAQLQAQQRAGNVLWDVVVCSPNTALSFPELFAPIDTSVVTSTDDFVVEGGLGENRVLLDLEVFPMFAYRNDVFEGAGPQSWTDYYDVEKFPGPRGAPDLGLDSAWLMPATALLAEGVAPEDLVPFDLDRAYAKLDAIKPDIRAFYDGFSAAQDLLRSKEVVMAIMTDARTTALAVDGQPVTGVFNQGFQYRASLCTPKDAPNADNAMQLYEYILSHPEHQVTWSTITYYRPPTNAGFEAVEQQVPEVAEAISYDAASLVPDSDELLTYIQENSDELLNRWNDYLQG
jgi:spermidine/putrescine-binding protein